MALCNIGRTIVDEAKLCYSADDNLLDDLATITEYREEDGFILFRTPNTFYKHCFTIHWGAYGNHTEPIARMYFSHIGNVYESDDPIQGNYVFFRLENHILYTCKSEVKKVLGIPLLYGLIFHHFTRLDLAKDFKFNIVNIINRLMKRTDIGTIINRHWEDDHKKKLDCLKEFRSRTLDKSIHPELVIMQKNAIENKNNGIIVAAYNKLEEIRDKGTETTAYKPYILDYYGSPKKSLHRLEARINAANITKYCEEKEILMTEDILFDEELLTDMFYECLSRVLRFSHVQTSKSGKRTLREKIHWKDILCNKKI